MSASTTRPGATAILPTPVVGVLGVIDDVARAPVRTGHEPGETLLLLGDTRDEFDGSIWAQVTAASRRATAGVDLDRSGCSPMC